MAKTINELNEKIWYRALKIVYTLFYFIALLMTILLAADGGDFYYGALGLGGVILFFEIVKRACYYLFLGKLFPDEAKGFKQFFSSSVKFVKIHQRKLRKVLIVTLALALLIFTVPLVWEKIQSVHKANEQIEKAADERGEMVEKFTDDNEENLQMTFNNISISNPYDLKISESEMPISEADPDISITVKPLSEYVKKCVEPERGEWATESAYREILEGLKNTGKHPDLPGYDSMGCGWTRGNINNEYATIDGLNAIIYNKALYQEIGSLSVFYKQVIFIDENDNVYDIIFNYSFGELEEYLNSIKDQYGSAYPYDFDQSENWQAIENVWQEVFDYFDKNKPILDVRTQGFQENDAIIKEMIKSIKVDRGKKPVLASVSSPEIQEEDEVKEESYSGYSTFHGYDCTEDCSGHEAGYEWAEENDIDDTYDCDGNSDSFIEGCEAYVEENY